MPDLGICQQPTKMVSHSRLKTNFTCSSSAALPFTAECAPWSFLFFGLQMPANAS